MNDNIDERLKNIEILLNKKYFDKSFFSKNLGPFISIFMLIVGIIIAWTAGQESLKATQKDVAVLQENIGINNSDIKNLRIKITEDSSELRFLKESVLEIKQDVKKLLTIMR